MKKYTVSISAVAARSLPRGNFHLRRFAVSLAFGAAAFGMLASRTAAQGEPVEIGVRSFVPDKTYLWAHNKDKIKGDGGHSKIYGIFKVSLIRAPEDLVRPVDEKRITSILMHELEANGFKEFVPGQRPDILITASYGRGEVANPYTHGTGAVGGVSGSVSQSALLSSNPDDGNFKKSMFPSAPGPGNWTQPISQESAAPSQVITDIDQLYEDKERGHEANLQKAGYEKIFIRVTAWQYPKASAKKPLMLWKTVMVVDDPDHRDLNDVAEAMLKAGAPLFDKLPKDREVLVNTTLPDGRVDVGVPEVVGPAPVKLRK